MATGIFQTTFPGTVALQQRVQEADYIIGLDLHKKTTAMAVIDQRSGETVFNRPRLPNDQVLKTILKECPGKRIVVTETAFGWWLMRDASLSLPDTTFNGRQPRGQLCQASRRIRSMPPYLRMFVSMTGYEDWPYINQQLNTVNATSSFSTGMTWCDAVQRLR